MSSERRDHGPDAASPRGEFDERSDAFFSQTQPLLMDRPDEALAVGLAAERRSRSIGDELGAVRGLLLQGMAHSVLGNAERDAVLAEVLRQAEMVADPVMLVRAVNAQIVVDVYRGQYSDALWRGQSILGMAHALRRNDLVLRLTINLGTALNLIGEFVMAIAMFEECSTLLQGQESFVRQQRLRIDNNKAMAWLGVARHFAHEGERAGVVAEALGKARALAQSACEGAQREGHGELRAGSLDTLVGVLLELGEAPEALRWVTQVAEQSADLCAPGSLAWGIYALAHCRAELALPAVDPAPVLRRLRAIEALPGSQFREGELHAMLNSVFADALSRAGEHREALTYHRRWLQFEARTQSLLAREHALAVHRTLESLRGETEEFITHDLRNPLGAALIHLDAVLKSGLPQARQTRVVTARGHVQQAFDTADRYLTVLRTRHLRRADLKPIDLAELVDDVGERLAPPGGAGVRLDRDVEWGTSVRGDRISLLMAFNELLRDALAGASPGGCVEWRLAGAPDHVCLTVSEQGSTTWAMAFAERLRRASSPGWREGRHMAAAMLNRVAQLHDSRIELASAPGRGTFIEWRFPLAERTES